jgi:hypothetical protein
MLIGREGVRGSIPIDRFVVRPRRPCILGGRGTSAGMDRVEWSNIERPASLVIVVICVYFDFIISRCNVFHHSGKALTRRETVCRAPLISRSVVRYTSVSIA